MKTTALNLQERQILQQGHNRSRQLLKEGHVVAPVEVLMQMGNLTKERLRELAFWQKFPYLERVIQR